MKKIYIAAFMTAVFAVTAASAAFADDDITVYLNADKLSFEQAPIIRDDFTLVPFRAIFEKLDMTVQWSQEERRVTAQKDGTSITLYIDNNLMNVNGNAVLLDTPPIIYNDFTLVPLRAVSEAAGALVEWDEETRSVVITAGKSDFKNWASEVLTLTNNEREKNGLKPLEWDDSLASLAEERCTDMVNRNYFSHNNPDGETVFDIMKKAGISYWTAGENIAAGQYSPEAVVESWMNSEEHKSNILSPNFEKLGVGVVKGGTYGIYWAQEFATLK